MKCEEVRRSPGWATPLVGAPGVGWGTSGVSRGGPTAKSARFRIKRGEIDIKQMQRRCNSDEIGQIWTKSKEIEEIPQFYHGKGNFLQTDRQRHFSSQSWGTSNFGPPEYI